MAPLRVTRVALWLVSGGLLSTLLLTYMLKQSYHDRPGELEVEWGASREDETFWGPEDHAHVRAKIQTLMKPWTQPGKMGEAFDPDAWKSFELDTGFYAGSGVRHDADAGHQPAIYSPYAVYDSEEYKQQWRGRHVSCSGPRGRTLNDTDEDLLKAYRMAPGHFPSPFIGDANATGVDTSVCFNRYSRYAPYGLTPRTHQHIDVWPQSSINPEWSGVKWGQLQADCLALNQDRYDDNGPRKPLPYSDLQVQNADGNRSVHPRTAILIRTWTDYNYTENDLQSIRALVVETALLSGGEYQVFLFVNVKDQAIKLDDQGYHDVLQRHVPPELHDMSILWNEKILEEWYPEVGDWQVYWNQFMPLQWFSKTHPQFDFVWNWEVDARYTGSHYAFFESMSSFATQSPRKYAWERGQRFYIPSAHSSYSEWLADTDRTIRISEIDTIWGPRPYSTGQIPIGPVPPTSYAEDNFEWGVGEAADLITLLPMWDPRNTTWEYRNKIWNFVPGVRPHFSSEDGVDIKFNHPEFANIPRRVYINTVSRFSTRLLHAMHLENSAGRTMQAEMWPATVALHHGLKAIYAPHPIWSDRIWPAWHADAVFNADGGNAAQWNQGPDSIHGPKREHNFHSLSWYFDATFPKTLYRRWLGWKSWDNGSPFTGIGGSLFEEKGIEIELKHSSAPEQTSTVRVGGHGPMCLPPMLLHPVKKTYQEAESPPVA